MNRISRATAALAATTALAVTAAVTFAAVAPASGDDGRHAVHFTLANAVTEANSAQVFPGDASRCHFSATGAFDPCVVPITPVAGFDGTITGDLQGTQRTADEAEVGVFVSVGVGAIDFAVVDLERFEVSVAGCGAGSFVLRRDGNLGSPDSTWQIVANSGRGDLVGLSGSGTAVGAFSGPGGTFVDTFVGRIRCGRHHGEVRS